MMASPPFQPGVRFATLQDIPRLAIVAAAGCFHSSLFRYVHPLYRQYPVDTIASFRSECVKSLLNPSQALIVIEDDHLDDEIETVGEDLRAAVIEATVSTKSTGRIVVGYAVIDLTNDKQRIGTFQPAEVEGLDDTTKEKLQDDPLNLRRDIGTDEGQQLLITDVYQQHPEYFVNRMKLMRLAVHPRYLRRGHGRRLVQWWTDLADMDGIEACVLASTLGRLVYEAVGFEKTITKEVRGYPDHPEPVEVWVGIRPLRR